MSKHLLDDTLNDYKPWQTGILQDNTNILNNLKENLRNYEKGYKKYSIKTRSELPQIKTQHTDCNNRCDLLTKHGNFEKMKLRTLESKKKMNNSKAKYHNKSSQLKTTKSELKLVKSRDVHKRGLTSMQSIDNENKQAIISERMTDDPSRKSNKNKVFLINFDEQNKYRRLSKREIHQLIFGQRQRQKYRQYRQMR